MAKVDVPVMREVSFESEVDVAMERLALAQRELKDAKAALKGLLEARGRLRRP